MAIVSRRGTLAGLGALGFATLAGGPATVQASEGEIAANKLIVHRLFEEVFNDGNLDALNELLAPDIIGDDPTAATGIESYKQQQTAIRTQYEQFFSEFTWEMTDIAAEGSLVFVRATFTAKQLDAAKPDVTVQGFIEASLAGGKISQVWSLVDVGALTAQLQ